jgi:hypothetical protein
VPVLPSSLKKQPTGRFTVIAAAQAKSGFAISQLDDIVSIPMRLLIVWHNDGFIFRIEAMT